MTRSGGASDTESGICADATQAPWVRMFAESEQFAEANTVGGKKKTLEMSVLVTPTGFEPMIPP